MNGLLVVARAFHLASTLLLTGTIWFRCFVAAPAFRVKAGSALDQGVRIRLDRGFKLYTAKLVAFGRECRPVRRRRYQLRVG